MDAFQQGGWLSKARFDGERLVAPARSQIDVERVFKPWPVERAVDIFDEGVEIVDGADDAQQTAVDFERAERRRIPVGGLGADSCRNRAARLEGARVEIEKNRRLEQRRGGELETAGQQRKQSE